MATTHTTLASRDRVNGVTPAGRVIRTGTYLRFQDRASTTAPEAREYEAVVRWDGDSFESLVSFDRLELTV
jgi:hypothetical protein